MKTVSAISTVSDPYQDVLFEALEHANECILVTDPNGIILYMNKTYEEFLHVHDSIGRHVTEVIENTRMHIVAQTGQPEIASIQRINGHDMIANRIPIFKDSYLQAVFGTVTFKDVRQLHALAATVEQLKQEVDHYKGELRRQARDKLCASYGFDQIIGQSLKIVETKNLAKRVAKSDSTVLISGESGTGKELFAHAIHAASYRAYGPFIRVNCAAIPDSLLESELFGYEEGAFTGAVRKGKKGKFELAHHGTILLDEIGDMPFTLQAKLLRVLQEREIERVGGTRPIPVDVRIISSTNQNLPRLMQNGDFREDLFYRLNVVTVRIPPLRERMEDLQPLVYNILEQLRESTGIRVEKIQDAVWTLLNNHLWPGNVRELRNVLERALYMLDEGELKPEQISILRSTVDAGETVLTLKEALMFAEKRAILNALVEAKGDKVKAAQMLDISKSGLYQKIIAYGL